jgi:predicted aspartyl protease
MAPEPKRIPFRLMHNVIALPVKVNGTGPHTFVLDTGAGKTVLLPALAKELALELTPLTQETATGAGGSLAISIGSVREIEIDGTAVSDLQVAVVDLTGVEAKVGERIGGVIGYDVLSRFEVTINYRDLWVRLKPLPPLLEVGPPI